MRDYKCINRNGEVFTVAQLPTHVIDWMLSRPIDFEGDVNGVTESDIRDRLSLELFIRENNLRGKE